MNPSIKKLVSTFLLAAVLTSSLAWSTSALMRRKAVDERLAAASQGSANAFRPVSPAAGGQDLPGGGPGGENLTDSIAGLFAQQLVGINPEGPQSVQRGVIGLRVPTTTDLISYLSGNPPSKAALAPAPDESRIKVITDFTESDGSGYFAAVAEIESRFILDPAWSNNSQSFLDANGGPAWAMASESAAVKAREALYDLKVPAPFLPIHNSLLAFFSSTASFSGMMARDPVAAMGLFEEFDAVIAQKAADVQKATQDLQVALPQLISELPAAERPAWEKFLGVQVAQAQWVTIDPAHIATSVWNWLQKFWQDYKHEILGYLTGLLKNLLLQKLSEKIVEWAGGGGVPGYVANWVSFAVDASINANDRAVGFFSRSLCGNAKSAGAYGDIIVSALQIRPAPNSSGNTSLDWSTLGDAAHCLALDSQAARAQDLGVFRWDNYLHSLTNNPYNDTLTLDQVARRVAAAQTEGAKNEAVAGQGFTGVKKCQDGSAVDHEGTCADGSQAQIVTPGVSKKDLTSQSLTYIFDLITGTSNEDMKETLSQAVTAAIVSYVIKEGNGLFESSRSGGGGAGGFIPPPPAADLAGQLRQYRDMLERALDDTNIAIDSYNQAIRFLENAMQTCDEATAAEIQLLVEGFEAAVPPLQAQAQRIQGMLDIVKQFQQNPAAQTLAELQSRVGSFNSVAAIATQAAQDRAAAAAAAGDAADLVLECRPTQT